MFSDENLMVDDLAVRQRLDNFKLGKAMPPALANVAPRPGHRHQRSHSQNTSISSSASLSLSLSSSRSSGLQDLSHFSFGSMSSSSSSNVLSSPETASSSLVNSSPAPPPGPPSKRNSHHRRLSSVSTRHESAELMGVAIPDLPSASLEHNVNFGEKDSIRRRALWALEGKPDVAFSKVEIPELTTPIVEKMLFDFSTKPALSSGSFGNSLMGNKRDSFKLLPSSSSSKDQLGTLLEEEEEEDEEMEEDCAAKKAPEDSLPSPAASNEDLPVTPAPALSKSVPRPRPATLNLRPLSLTPENIGSATCQGLPTPSLTPSPRPGLRSLSLASSPAAEDSPSTVLGHSIGPAGAVRRPKLNLSVDSVDSSPRHDERKSTRRSSISYKSSSISSTGLPTPEATPTFSRSSRRGSASLSESVRSSKSGDEEFFPSSGTYRPLSASEQHFLYKSHNALLARITDLEKALSMRRRSLGGCSITGGSRPSSMLSDVSVPSSEADSTSTGEPSDEMLALVRDLKAERDELKKDVDGWRTRVADLDKQLGLVAKRVESERREAWVARSRVSLLEVEKEALDKQLQALDQVVAGLRAERKDLEERNQILKQQGEEKSKRVEQLERELEMVRKDLESVRKSSPGSFDATPKSRAMNDEDRWRQGLGLSSMGTADSADEEDPMFSFGFPSKAVRKAVEDSDKGDGSAGYEDEDDFGHEQECSPSLTASHAYPADTPLAPPPRSSPSTDGIKIDAVPVEASAVVPQNLTHRSRRSLSRVWTFPKAAPSQPRGRNGPSTVDSDDKFFGCLDESDTSDESGPVTPMPLNYEESKGLFASGLQFASDDVGLFVLPDGVGTVVEDAVPAQIAEKTTSTTEGVEECQLSDMEEDEEMFGEIGGIRIICTPPEEVEEEREVKQIVLASPLKPVSKPPTLPAFDFDKADGAAVDDGMSSFMFGQSQSFAYNSAAPQPAQDLSSSKMVVSKSPPRSASITATPPSSLPRVGPPRAAVGSAIPRPASRAIPRSPPTSAPGTPLIKSGGVSPSFIPQPASPSPSRVAPASSIPKPSLVRQPIITPKPSFAPNFSKPPPTNVDNEPHQMSCSPYRSIDPASSSDRREHRSSSETNMKSVDLRSGQPFQPSSSDSQIHHQSPHSSSPSQPISSILISSFSSFMPLSWSSSQPLSASPVTPQVDRKPPTFVTQEQQLIKLKQRMEREGVVSMTPHSVGCRRCHLRPLVNL